MFPDKNHAFLSPILIEFHRGRYQVEFGRELAQALENEIQPTDIVFVDSNVLHLYPEITKRIPPYTKVFTIEATEQKKDLLFIPEVIENVIGAGFRRGHRLVAIGGGIVQDIVSFSASILHRGVEWNSPPRFSRRVTVVSEENLQLILGASRTKLAVFFLPQK